MLLFDCCRFSEASVANKIMLINFDVHVGSIAGLSRKILAFCLSAITASLPVTGTLIWWGGLGLRQLPFGCLGFTKIPYFGCLNLFSQWHQQVN